MAIINVVESRDRSPNGDLSPIGIFRGRRVFGDIEGTVTARAFNPIEFCLETGFTADYSPSYHRSQPGMYPIQL